MVERVLQWDLFGAQPMNVEYTAIDSLPANIDAARRRQQDLPRWFDLRLETADVFDFCTRPAEQGAYDLLIAHAFLDLLDIPTALPRLRTLLRPGGLFYFTINFDGATILQPTIDAAFDDQIENAYHRTMDERITDGRPSGDSRTGRHLFTTLAAGGFHAQAAGSSDWVVHPVNGRYPADEAYFLHFIVHTMHGALCSDPAVGGEAFERWIETRHAQIDRGELVYIAHQLDFMGTI
jgi:SAM-dependent methyltransferase